MLDIEKIDMCYKAGYETTCQNIEKILSIL